MRMFLRFIIAYDDVMADFVFPSSGFCQQAQNLLIGGKKLEKGPKKCIVHQEGEDAQEEAGNFDYCSETA